MFYLLRLWLPVWLSFCCFIDLFGAAAPPQDLLDKQDIGRVMNQIASQHLGQQQVTGQLLQKALLHYIDQFDPERIYLLEGEVRPYRHLSKEKSEQLVADYREGNFSAFDELDQLFGRAIGRSRAIRRQAEGAIQPLFDQAVTVGGGNAVPASHSSFAANPQQLQERIQQRIVAFLRAAIRYHGQARTFSKRQLLLANYENGAYQQENSYLYRNEKNLPLAEVEKENLFALHVLKSLAKSLDLHTDFYAPQEAYDMRIRLQKGFKGVGVQLQKKTNGVFIEKILADSPASRNGSLQEGDRLLKVNGKPVDQLGQEELFELMQGEKEGEVDLLLKGVTASADQVKEVRLKPELINIDEGRVTSSSVPVEGGIVGTIVIPSFYKGANGVTTTNDVRAALEQLARQAPLKGLILDLRDNSGGFLTEAVTVAGLFISNGVIVVSKYANGEERYYRDMDGKTFYRGPLLLLTSKMTASAAEIVAQALQDWGVGLVVGDQQTYGKGTIQSQTVTGGNGSAYFKVTVGKYYTASGKTPQLKGVQADIVIPGQYANQPIGEEFVEGATPNDTIAAVYSDQLTDVQKKLHPWYLRYYMPTLQHPSDRWRQLLPQLRDKSRQRLEKSELTALQRQPPQREEQIQKIRELQHQEAVQVVRDMIQAGQRQNGSSLTGR